MIDLTSSHSVYEQLRRLILSFEFAPNDILIERALETRFGFSRTPVRAALSRLENDGLVKRVGRSYSVSSLNLLEIEQAFEARILIECESIRKACHNYKEEDIERLIALEASAHSEILERKLEFGLAFHLEIAKIANNQLFVKILRDINGIIYRATWLQAASVTNNALAHDEHTSLIAAIKERDSEKAVQLMSFHILRAKKQLVKMLQELEENPRKHAIYLLKKAA